MDIQNEVFTAAFGTQTLTRGTEVIERPGWYQVISPNNKTPSANEVIHSAMAEDAIEKTIEETIQVYEKIGTAFKWCTSPFTEPKNMGDILEKKYGFGSWSARGMFARVDELNITSPSGVSLEPLDQQNLNEYIETFLNGWILDRDPTPKEKSQLEEDLKWALENRAGKACYYLARYEGEAAGTSGFFLKEQSAYFVGGNVLKSFRGKGIYRGLLAKRIQEVKHMGYQLIVTGARENTSAPILERLGFQTAYRDQIYQYGGTLPE